MPSIPALHVSSRILRWDQAPSEFWEAVIRIGAELGYQAQDTSIETASSDVFARRVDIVSVLPHDMKERLLTLTSQLPWLLPALRRALHHSYTSSEGQRRIDYYCEIFSQACRRIDLSSFIVDDDADEETRWQQIDALSRAMLFKSDLLLIHAQFELLRDELHKTRVKRSYPKIVA